MSTLIKQEIEKNGIKRLSELYKEWLNKKTESHRRTYYGI